MARLTEKGRQEAYHRKRAARTWRKDHGIPEPHKPTSAKQKNQGHDKGICLVCKKPRLKCTCSGHMSEAAYRRFFERV